MKQIFILEYHANWVSMKQFSLENSHLQVGQKRISFYGPNIREFSPFIKLIQVVIVIYVLTYKEKLLCNTPTDYQLEINNTILFWRQRMLFSEIF